MQTINLAINGFGRIGRNTLRALYENAKQKYANQGINLNVVAINDLGNAATNAHLLKYDTVHGKFSFDVSIENDYILVNGDKIRVLANKNPAELPWDDL